MKKKKMMMMMRTTKAALAGWAGRACGRGQLRPQAAQTAKAA